MCTSEKFMISNFINIPINVSVDFLPPFLSVFKIPIPLPPFHIYVVIHLLSCPYTPLRRPYYVRHHRILTSNFTSLPASPAAFDCQLLIVTRSLFFCHFPRSCSSISRSCHGSIHFLFNFTNIPCSRRFLSSLSNRCHQTFNH